MSDKEDDLDLEPKASSNGFRGDLYRYSGVGLEFAILVGLLVFGGYSLDQHFHPDGFPWFLLLGLFMGIGLGTWRLIFQVGRDQ